MTDVHSELLSLTQNLRELVKQDLLDGATGYPITAAAPAAAGAPVVQLPTQQATPDLRALRDELGDCARCKLCRQGRNTIVFGEGDPNADLMFAGEGPGYYEDKSGRPFVGKAGELLDKMIVAMGLSREQVYICNVVKCRPPNNRDPEPDEIAACRPFLEAQVRSIRPKVVVTLGRFAGQTLLNSSQSMGRMRGRFYPYLDAKLMPTYHPAYLLRNPHDKGKAWADLKLVMAELGLTR